MAAPGQVLRTEVASRLQGNWKRSALPSLAIPDPGHGLDEISPVVEHGLAFDPASDAETAPFLAKHIADWPSGDEIVPGTGYLEWLLRFVREDLAVPGEIPELVADYALDIWIRTPTKRGGDQAALYASALNLIFRQWSIHPGGDVIEISDSDDQPSELPAFDGQDAFWRYDKHTIPLSIHYRARPA